jgi:hypothetical protein
MSDFKENTEFENISDGASHHQTASPNATTPYISMYIESNRFRLYVCKKEYTRFNSIIEYAKLAAPEDDPLESKHAVLHMLIHNCCADGGICIVDWPYISLNTEDFCSVRLATEAVTYFERCLRQRTVSF